MEVAEVFVIIMFSMFLLEDYTYFSVNREG